MDGELIMAAATSQQASAAVSIRFERVEKSFEADGQRVTIFHELSLNLDAGRFIAIMGPSGSGKSTLLNLISGLDRPTRGQIYVGGLSLEAMSDNRLASWRARNIGFVFQSFNLISVLTAAENVEVPLLLTKLSASRRRASVNAALRLVGIAELAKRRPGKMSGGQQQRVAIARALVADPAVLLCDEPTGNLDRETADSALTLLRTLSHELHKTIVMVTHDPAAAAMADAVVRVDKGYVTAVEDRR